MTINQCAYVSWYKFKRCNVTTCKNHTTAFDCQCLAVGRKQPEGTKVISDEEIRLFKYHGRQVSTRLVSSKRKAAVERVKATLTLMEFIQYIKRHYGNHEHHAVFKHKALHEREVNFPLKIKLLGFKNWMWEYLMDSNVYKTFIEQKSGECSTYSLQHLLAMDEQKWQQFTTEVAHIF